jgi:hypothetical protein
MDRRKRLVRHVVGCVSRTVIELSYFVFLVYAQHSVRPFLRVSLKCRDGAIEWSKARRGLLNAEVTTYGDGMWESTLCISPGSKQRDCGSSPSHDIKCDERWLRSNAY